MEPVWWKDLEGSPGGGDGAEEEDERGLFFGRSSVIPKVRQVAGKLQDFSGKIQYDY